MRKSKNPAVIHQFLNMINLISQFLYIIRRLYSSKLMRAHSGVENILAIHTNRCYE